MVKKLMLLLTAVQRRWNLPYKAALWALALGVTAVSGFWWAWVLVYAIVSVTAYLGESHDRTLVRASYWLTVAVAPILLYLQAASRIPFLSSVGMQLVVSAFLGALMWAILGIMRSRFSETRISYVMMHTVLLIVVTLAALGFIEPYRLGMVGIGFALVLYLLFRELGLFFNIPRRKRTLMGVLMVLIALELSWFVLLLPLGILNATAFIVLALVLIRDVLLTHAGGKLSTVYLFRQFTFLTLFMIIIFAASRWTL